MRETLPGLTPVDPAAGLGAGEHKPGLPRPSVHFLFTRIQLLSVLHTTTRIPTRVPVGTCGSFLLKGVCSETHLQGVFHCQLWPDCSRTRLCSALSLEAPGTARPWHGPPPADGSPALTSRAVASRPRRNFSFPTRP